MAAAAVLVLGGVAPAVPAAAEPRPIRSTYAVTAPAPYVLYTDGGKFGRFGCDQGIEGVHKETRSVTLPRRGLLTVRVSFYGDWDLYLLDGRGRPVDVAASGRYIDAHTGYETLAYRHRGGQRTFQVVACNTFGHKDATVSYVFHPLH